MLQQNILHGLGRDLLPAAVNLILGPTHHGERAVFKLHDVPSAIKPLVSEGSRVHLRGSVIAADGVRTTGEQMPLRTFRHLAVVLIHHPNLIKRAHRPALGGDDFLNRCIERRVVHQPLSHAKDLLQLPTQFRLDPLRHGCGELGSAHPHRAHG